MTSDTRLPISLFTGFLGSRKTTLIAAMLREPALADTVVIVNEIGEIGIDHHLLRRVDERTVLLESGCLCCSLRGDLADELLDLAARRDRREIPEFARVVIETTGLAEPAPIVHTLLNDPGVRAEYRLQRVIATVDATHGLRTEESVHQAIAADRIVLTKTDVSDATDVMRELEELNPAADVVTAVHGRIDPDRLLGGSERDLRELPDTAHDHRHDGIESFGLVLDDQLDWTAFGVWLSMLLAARGDDVFRVKGLLDTGGDGPVLLNTVQHVVHPLVHLDSWPDDDRRSRIVFIGRGLDRAAVERSLTAFNRAAAT